MIKEFREFILRGSVVDLAVAVVIGAAFGAIVTSLVTDILTPLLGLFGVPDFRDASLRVGSADLRWGNFLNTVIAFVMIALAIFLVVVKPMNALNRRHKTEADVESETKECLECLSSIPRGARRCAFCTSEQAA